MQQGDRLTELNYNIISHLGYPNGDRVRFMEVTVEQSWIYSILQ